MTATTAPATAEVVLDVLRGGLGRGARAFVCGRAKAGCVRVGAAPLKHNTTKTGLSVLWRLAARA